MIITVTLNPALDRYAVVENFETDRVNRISRLRVDAGGKGVNVSKLLSELGCETLAAGVIGGSGGAALKAMLDQKGIKNEFVAADVETRTNLKIFDPLNKTYTDINEAGYEMTDEIFGELADRLFAAARKGDMAVLAGKPPKGTDAAALASWVSRLKTRGVDTAVDMEGDELAAAVRERPFIVKPNEDELARLCSLADTETATLLAAAKELAGGGIEYTAVSMGERGALFVTKDAALLARSERVSAVSTVGAGDALLAGFIYSLREGYTFKEAARFACAAATAKVLCEGSSMPKRADVERRLAGISVFAV